MNAAPLQIGSLRLASNVLLAPIAGYCDLAFRLVARSWGGVGMACTDLLCPEGVLRDNPRALELAMTCPEDSPLAMQLYGNDVERLCEAARWAEDRGAHVVDINMGCPVDKITKRDGGSKLLCDPDRTLRMVERIVAALRRVPLTAKLRLGWDEANIVAPYLAARLEEAGVALVCVHGRTAAMKFGGQARWDAIGEVVAAVKRIPVVGNGDVRTAEDAQRMIGQTGCAGVMVGRGALSAPWLARDIWGLLSTGIVPAEPTLEQKVQNLRDHFANMLRYRGAHTAVSEMRRRVSWYAKYMNPCPGLREELRLLERVEDFEPCLRRFLDWRRSGAAAVTVAAA